VVDSSVNSSIACGEPRSHERIREVVGRRAADERSGVRAGSRGLAGRTMRSTDGFRREQHRRHE
jgi:hypothetical protein